MKPSRRIWLVVIGGMVVLFIGALVVNMRHGAGSTSSRSQQSSQTVDQSNRAEFTGERAPVAGSSAGAAATVAPAAEAPALDSAAAPAASTAGGATVDQQGFNRLIIKTASITLQVEKVTVAEAAVRAKVNQLGGYIVEAQTSGTDDDVVSRITFRVPVARFDEALAGLDGLATKLLDRSVNGNDATEEYVDLDSRLRNLEATRARLVSFLDKAVKVDDALAVNQSLTDVQGQIEQIQGRKKYLEQSAAFSTITVALSPVPAVPQLTEAGWQPLAVAREALRGVIAFVQVIIEMLIVLLVWSPVWGVVAVLGLLGWRRWRGPKAAASKQLAGGD